MSPLYSLTNEAAGSTVSDVPATINISAFVIYLYVHNGKQKTSVLLAKGYLRSLGFVTVLAAVIAVLCVIDFTQVFTVFHHIFFDNDLWILYPDKDNLINIMQEDVFSDAAMWIAGIWLAVSTLIAALCVIIIRKDRYSVNSAVE